MSQDFQPGDFLIFQVESAFGLLRILAVEEVENHKTWHIAAFEDMFLDIDTADSALKNSAMLKIAIPHAAITNRAFEATQTSRMKNELLTESDLKPFEKWKNDPKREITDTNVRLLLGLR